MTKKIIVFVATLLTFSAIVKSQTNLTLDSTINIEKARYLKENLSKLLSDNISYPYDGLMNYLQGDVIVSFTIKRNGRLDSLNIISSPGTPLSTNSIIAITEIEEEEWSPAKINSTSIDKKYLFIFRYRIYEDAPPYDYTGKAQEKFVNKKYEKSLKLYNKAIKDNQYNSELFLSRSKVKQLLGDKEGAKKDQLTSIKLKDEIMEVVDVISIGVSKLRLTGGNGYIPENQ